MGTIAQNLASLVASRDNIKLELGRMGQSPNDSLSSYGNRVRDIVTDWLCFTCVSSEGASIAFTKSANKSGTLYWTKDRATWQTYSSAITLGYCESVWLRGSFASGMSASDTDISQFSMTGKVAASGNIMSLRQTIPSLWGSAVSSYHFAGLFKGCTGLVTAPKLPAMTLETYCYSDMFYGCTGLAVAPALPATTLKTRCYDRMFYGCTGLTASPVLPAPTLVSMCYSQMFYGCSSLNYIKALFTTTPSRNNVNAWVSGVAASGTFVKNSAAAWTTTGNNGVPTGWAVETASV
ncbi:MAG: hypothetical protein IKM71_01860 [Bacteroidaceae bacterium]|nr:hypothetical protein [Bacteroidaceae bacterium]